MGRLGAGRHRLVCRRQRQRHRSLRPRVGWWLRWARARRTQRQPRCGVDARRPGDAPTRPGPPRGQLLSPAARLADVVTRSDLWLRPDPGRVVTRLFVPGEELPSDASRASPLIERILAMSDEQMTVLLADVF